MRIIFPVLLFLVFNAYSSNGDGKLLKQLNSISFTENKGQVSDQFNKPRADVLFSGNDGHVFFHLKKDGISYQVNKYDSLVERSVTKFNSEKERKIYAKTSIYRVDVDWLNCNANPQIVKTKMLSGYNTYYYEVCPNGVTGVRSYNEITYKDLYNNIDLVWHTKNGKLKYDYRVKKGGDYKNIALKYSGALKINVDNKGELVIATPFGNLVEQAPYVTQGSKQLKSYWIVKDNTVSFGIDNYDPNREMIIDPEIRLWGTYYGGINNDYAYSCATDTAGNVIMTGETRMNTSAIATSGAHQVGFNGGYNDGFLVKFNKNGVRQWGTYYGGSQDDLFYSCATDIIGNIFATGNTQTGTSTVIATASAHQWIYSGNMDGMLVKFNSAGVRQWATYYGGQVNDSGFECRTDNQGNVYMSGWTGSTVNIATGNGFQSTTNGGPEAFLVKFNSAGTRIWGTYYGSYGADVINCCSADALGNSYIVGTTSSLGSISTPGSFQTVLGASGGTDAFIVKFDPAGVRQWGTYYGGPIVTESGLGCALDKSGNLYLSGYDGGGTYLSTPNGFQVMTYSGDAFFVRFSASGIRKAGTGYGGSSYTYGYGCATDQSGNSFMCGVTDGGNIASAGAHQTVYGGSEDAFLVKFKYCPDFTVSISSNSTTCQGGNDGAASVTVTGGYGGPYTYLWSPSSSTLSAISSLTNGIYTVVYKDNVGCGGYNTYTIGYMNATPVITITPSSNSVCANSSTTLTATGASTYTWSTSAISNSIVITPSATAVYTVTGTGPGGCVSTKTRSIGVYITPTVSATSFTLCSGDYTTIPHSGAVNYTITGGTFNVTPTVTTTYSIIGSSNGCPSSNTAICTITVMPLPILTASANPPSICLGQSCTLTASGTVTNFAWAFGPPTSTYVVWPNYTTPPYSVSGVGANGCYSVAYVTVTINPTPTIAVSSSAPLLCLGGTSTLTASGAATYTWTNGPIGNIYAVNPTVTTIYTVSATSALGCTSTAFSYTQNVSSNPQPTVTVNTTDSIICVGNTVTLTVTGATTYSWISGPTTSVYVVSPTVTTIYTVQGTSLGCKEKVMFTQSVSTCAGQWEQSGNAIMEWQILPNPNTGSMLFVISGSATDKTALEIYDALGRSIKHIDILGSEQHIDLNDISKGVYYFKLCDTSGAGDWKKVIITQ